MNCLQLRKSSAIVMANDLLKSVFYCKLAVNCCNLLGIIQTTPRGRAVHS